MKKLIVLTLLLSATIATGSFKFQYFPPNQKNLIDKYIPSTNKKGTTTILKKSISFDITKLNAQMQQMLKAKGLTTNIGCIFSILHEEGKTEEENSIINDLRSGKFPDAVYGKFNLGEFLEYYSNP